MTAFPYLEIRPLVTINTFSLEALGPEHVSFNYVPASISSKAWPTANKALGYPFFVGIPITIKRLFTANGATASGNLDIGIYDPSGVRIISTGTTAQSGTDGIQFIEVTDTVIGPGIFYAVMAFDGTTGTYRGPANYPNRRASSSTGLIAQASAFVLPATMTFTSYSEDQGAPLFGLTTRTV